mgnify:CR=1 FL=1
MKKIILVTIVVVLLCCSACINQKESTMPLSTASSTAAVSETPEPRVKFEPWEKYQDVLPIISFDWEIYQSLDELVDKTDYIAVATVLDIDVFLHNDEPRSESSPLQDTMINYTICIDRPLKGGLTQNSNISVWQRGWRYNDVNIWHPDIPPLEYDKTYLLFFIDNEYPLAALDVDYYVGMPFESYPEIRDGKLYPHPYSHLFRNEQRLDNIILAITQLIEKKTAHRDALICLTAEQGAERLSSCLHEDQVAIRKLTSEEMQLFLDFSGSDAVEETAGSELKNSDIFIWIKTNELTKTQQAELKTTFTQAAARIAEERNWGYKVSVTPFHSLVCISRGEDRATIHEAFHRILDELVEID